MSSVFDEMIDQEAVIAIIKGAVSASKDSKSNSQEMTHSWLFTGPPGSGRTNAAIAFAAALLCQNSGCGVCTNCSTVKDGSHADIELIRTEGLSIKVDEVRELITRTSWSPSVGNYRVVVIEDADRLTESAANALLKVIEEPGARTIWLLCAPTLTDVLPTIRSRCRHLNLRTPSVKAIAKLLITRNGIDPKMAEFASSTTQGHIGRAKYLATNKEAREIREKILDLPSAVLDLSSAFEAASTLLEMAKEQAKKESDIRNEEELTRLKESYGTTSSRLATGVSQAVKEMEKEQKFRASRLVKNFLDLASLDIEIQYRNEIIENIETKNNSVKVLENIKSLEGFRRKLEGNISLQLALESLFCELG